MSKQVKDVAVHCAHDKMIRIEDLKPNPKNYNKHPDRQVALLAKNIRELGWRHPIIVSKRSGFIVSGHARLEAAKMLNVDKVPVNYQDYKSDAEELAVVVADNKLASLAEVDNAMLKDILIEMDTGDFDMDLTGYMTDDIEALMNQTHQGSIDLEDGKKQATDTKSTVTCPKCGFVI